MAEEVINTSTADVNDKIDSQSSSVDGTVVPNPPDGQVTTESAEGQKEQVDPKIENESSTSWDPDETSPNAAVIPTSSFDFSKVASGLGLGEIKDQDDFITKATAQIARVKELEVAPLLGVPAEFRELVEIAKTGANWKDYLAEDLFDYRTIDPVKLYEDQYILEAKNAKDPRFITPEGVFDENAAYAALDAMPLNIREEWGKQIQNISVQKQQTKKAQIKAQAQAKLDSAVSDLAKATQTLGEAIPFETYGLKVEPKHSTETYQGITSSKLTRDHLGADYQALIQAGVNMKKLTRTIFLAEKAEKMLKFKSDNSKAVAKKDILASTQNAQITTPGKNLNPSDPKLKVLTPEEKMAKYVATLNSKNFFGS